MFVQVHQHNLWIWFSSVSVCDIFCVFFARDRNYVCVCVYEWHTIHIGHVYIAITALFVFCSVSKTRWMENWINFCTFFLHVYTHTHIFYFEESTHTHVHDLIYFNKKKKCVDVYSEYCIHSNVIELKQYHERGFVSRHHKYWS